TNNFLLMESVLAEDAIKLYVRQDGTWTELDAHTGAGLAVDVVHVVSLSVDGDAVVGTLDGTPVLSATLTAGQIASLGTRAGLYNGNQQTNWGWIKAEASGAAPALPTQPWTNVLV